MTVIKFNHTTSQTGCVKGALLSTCLAIIFVIVCYNRSSRSFDLTFFLLLFLFSHWGCIAVDFTAWIIISIIVPIVVTFIRPKRGIPLASQLLWVLVLRMCAWCGNVCCCHDWRLSWRHDHLLYSYVLYCDILIYYLRLSLRWVILFGWLRLWLLIGLWRLWWVNICCCRWSRRVRCSGSCFINTNLLYFLVN